MKIRLVCFSLIIGITLTAKAQIAPLFADGTTEFVACTPTSGFAQRDESMVQEDGSSAIAVLSNDLDSINPLDTASLTVLSAPMFGNSMVDAASGQINYTPLLNYYGTDSFSYQICNTCLNCDTAWVLVLTEAVNDAPIVRDDSILTTVGSAISIDVLANDDDNADLPLGGLDSSSLAIAVPPMTGTTTVDVSDWSILYQPAIGFSGIDSFAYLVGDIGEPLPAKFDTAWVRVKIESDIEFPGWELTCASNTSLEVIGRGILNEDTALLFIPTPSTVDSSIIEVVAKGFSLPTSCIVLTDSGSFVAQAFPVASSTVPAVTFRATIPSSTSVRIVTNQPGSTFSAVAYVFRSSTAFPIQGSASFVQINLFNDTFRITTPIAIDSISRDVHIVIPITELNNDARIGIVRATAGPVSVSDTFQVPTLGTSLNIVELLLEDVPGSVSSVQLEVISPPAPIGDSYLFSTVAVTLPSCPVDSAVLCAGVSVDLGLDTFYTCTPVELTLAADAGFNNYQWNTGDTTSSILVTGPGSYAVEVTNSFGCAASDTAEVVAFSVEILPGDTTICAGETLLLQAIGGIDYVWSTGETTSTITVNPSATTMYDVSSLQRNTVCSDSVTVSVESSAAPVFTSCPADIVATSSDGSPIAISWPSPTATDNCYGPASILQLSGLPSGSAFPVGVTQVVFVATDSIGQSDTCRFSVNISAPCPVPPDLDALVSANGALLSWTKLSQHLGFQLKGRLLGASSSATITTTSDTRIVAGLASATTYEWRIRAKCIDNSISGFSPFDTFTTLSPRESGALEMFQISPNPATNSVVIFAAGEFEHLMINDLTGRIVHQQQALGDAIEMSVADWARGIYLVTLKGPSGTLTQKLMVE